MMHSGKLNVRLPIGLHDALANEAERQGSSLNTLIVALLSAALSCNESGKVEWTT